MTLISLHVCAGWSEPLLVAHTTLLEISCHSSNFSYQGWNSQNACQNSIQGRLIRLLPKKQSDLGLRHLSGSFWGASSVQISRTFTVEHDEFLIADCISSRYSEVSVSAG